MAKKQNKTFAQRAQSIIKSYKRADWDPIEKAALESSLNKLQQEQEAYKQTNGIERFTPEQEGSSNMFAGDEGGSYIPVDNFYTQEYGYMPENNPVYTPQAATPTVPISTNQSITSPKPVVKSTSNKSKYPPLVSAPDMGEEFVMQESAPVTEGVAMQGNKYVSPAGVEDTEEGAYSPYQTSIAPSLISGATSALGNLYLASQQKGNDDVKLPRISAPKISLERGRQAATREANKANQRIKYASKGAARTRGEYAANRIAGEANVAGKLGETLSASHEKESLVNANMKLGMDKYNAEMKAKETMLNKAQKIKNKKEKEAYLSAAMSTIGKTTKDINAAKRDDMYLNAMGDNYGWYMEKDPNAKWYQKKQQRKIKYNK